MRLTTITYYTLLICLLATSLARVTMEPAFTLNSPHQHSDWKKVGRGDALQKIELIFAVKQNNLEKLEDTLLDVSDPLSKNYGKHLSNDEVHKLVAPSQEAVDAVMDFLKNYDVSGVSATPNSDMITATVSIDKANELLQADYYSFMHRHTARVVHRTASYALPVEVARYVDFVAPTIKLPYVSKTSSIGDSPIRIQNIEQVEALYTKSRQNTPESLRKLYSVNSAVGSTPTNRLAVTAYLEEHYSPEDLATFQERYCTEKGVPCGGPTPVVPHGDDGGPKRLGGVEAMLDIEYIQALGANISSEFWGYSGRSPDNSENEPFLKWLQDVSSTADDVVPLVFSSSYGEDETSISMEWAQRINAEFQKCGARGLTLLFSSGDSGAAGINGCEADGSFLPQWPSGSPWVTAVGGTQGGAKPEVVVPLSSGGFSNRWTRPSYQKDVVQGYLDKAVANDDSERDYPDTSKYNSKGRAFPDISAQAANFVVVAKGTTLPSVAGTSASCPTVAGIVALLNDGRLASGKSSLGFLNPLLYSDVLAGTGAFNDITMGYNHGCSPYEDGFPAAEGWDAATGQGTPDFENFAKAIQDLQ